MVRQEQGKHQQFLRSVGNYLGTSVVNDVVRKIILSRPEFKNRVLELNASDERGIKVIRKKVKGFSQLSASSQPMYPLITHFLTEKPGMGFLVHLLRS
jgi:hypothetical protein